MNVVEALVVTLGLDNAQFEAQLKKSVQSLQGFMGKESELDKQRGKEKSEQDRKLSEQESKQAKLREQQLKSAAEGYTKVRNAIFGMVAATLSIAGIKSFVTGSVDGLIAMKRASTNLGMSIKEVDAWGRAVASVGGNKDAILQTMQNIRGGIEAFQTGLDPNSQTVKALASMGVQWQNADGSIRKVGEMLPEIANALQKFDAQKQLVLADQLGIDADTLELLRKGGPAVQELYAKQLQLSRATEEGAQKALQFKAKWAEIKGKFESTGQTLFMALVPALERLNELLLMFANWVSANSEQIGGFFSGVADVMTGIVGIFSDLHAKTDGWSTRLLAVVAGFIALKGILGGILGLTGLGKLGVLAATGAAAWAAGSWINKNYVEGTSFGDWVGRTGAKTMAMLGSKDAKEALNAEARANGQELPYPELDGIQKTGKAQAATATHQLEEAKKGNKAATQAASEQNNWLKKIEGGISKMNAAFDAGYAGQPMPSGAGLVAGVAHSAGTLTGVVVNSALGQIMKKAEGDYGVVNTGKRHGYRAARVNLEGMTVAQVMAAQARGDFNAAGRYQIIGSTMRDAAKTLGLSGNEMFDKKMQDRIFVEYLLKHKRKAVWNYIHGKSDNLNAAMLAMSQEWASFAAPAGAKTHRGLISDGNMSFYAGNGVDKASVSAAQSAAMLQQLRAQVMSSGSTNNRSEVHIGQVNIQTAATDAKGIAQEIRPAVNRSLSGVALGAS